MCGGGCSLCSLWLNGIMWFNTKLNLWVRLVGRDGKKLPSFMVCDTTMAEHDGKLAVLYWGQSEGVNTITKGVWCTLVSLDKAGDMICGTIDWSGTVGTVPYCRSVKLDRLEDH